MTAWQALGWTATLWLAAGVIFTLVLCYLVLADDVRQRRADRARQDEIDELERIFDE